MRRLSVGMVVLALMCAVGSSTHAQTKNKPAARTGHAAAATGTVQQFGPFVIIAWNDLGMHCISGDFADMAILPPANTVHAVVIRKAAEEPKMTTTGLTVSYALDNNQSVTGKSNFWQYSWKLFGKNLQPGVGLTGNGLKGNMKVVGDHFEATAIPALPLNDQMQWNPYQTATVTLLSGTKVLGVTSVVVPVSDELNCGKCHDKGGAAAAGINTGKVTTNILTLHDIRQKTSLMSQRPVLCSGCHSDNALNLPGKKGVSSLSLAMHDKHANVAAQPACFDCHPGAKTHCNRSAIPAMGPVADDPNCQACHGDLKGMAAGLKAGRQPWLQEPTCAQCHGQAYSTGTTLYRNAKGHGGVYCVTCHNSPHAWWPSKNAVDNVQPVALQGDTHALGFNNCQVCHTDGRKGRMPPHGGDGGGD